MNLVLYTNADTDTDTDTDADTVNAAVFDPSVLSGNYLFHVDRSAVNRDLVTFPEDPLGAGEKSLSWRFPGPVPQNQPGGAFSNPGAHSPILQKTATESVLDNRQNRSKKAIVQPWFPYRSTSKRAPLRRK